MIFYIAEAKADGTVCYYGKGIVVTGTPDGRCYMANVAKRKAFRAFTRGGVLRKARPYMRKVGTRVGLQPVSVFQLFKQTRRG